MRVIAVMLLLSLVYSADAGTRTGTDTGKGTDTGAGIGTGTGTGTGTVPFNVVCSDTRISADVFIPKTHALEDIGECKPKKDSPPSDQTRDKYILDELCLLNGGQFFVSKVNKNGIAIKASGKAYKVICDVDEGRTVTIQQGFRVSMPTDNPVVYTITAKPYPNDQLKLYLFATNPKKVADFTTDLATATTKAAVFGHHVFLGILNTKSEPEEFIPLSCKATDGTKSAFIWMLHSSDDRTTCFWEDAIVKSSFSKPLPSNNKLYTAEIEAFKFANSQSATITISCNVRVCTTGVTKGTCQEDSDALKKCNIPQNSANSGNRRRREVEVASKSNGRIHHVTATLRVLDDVKAQGTGGSSLMTYTLPCLMMSLLVKFLY